MSLNVATGVITASPIATDGGFSTISVRALNGGKNADWTAMTTRIVRGLQQHVIASILTGCPSILGMIEADFWAGVKKLNLLAYLHFGHKWILMNPDCREDIRANTFI